MSRLPSIALSVRQPWAWAIIHGGKDVENRSAAGIRHRSREQWLQRIAIHASKGMTRDEYELAADFMGALDVLCPPPAALIRGAIIGSVEFTDIVSESASPWFFGPRGLVLRDPVACKPVPANGQLGLFQWSEDPSVTAPMARWMMADRPAPKKLRDAPLFEGVAK